MYVPTVLKSTVWPLCTTVTLPSTVSVAVTVTNVSAVPAVVVNVCVVELSVGACVSASTTSVIVIFTVCSTVTIPLLTLYLKLSVPL